MKILFICHTYPYPPHQDGSANISYNLIKNISKNNQLEIFYLGFSGEQEIFKSLKTKKFSLKNSGKAVYYLAHSFLNSLPWGVYKYYSKELAQEIKKVDQEKKYDLIFIDSPFLANYLPFIKNTPKIINLVDDITSWFLEAAKKEKTLFKKVHLRLEGIKNRKIEKKFYPQADKCILVGEGDRKKLLERGFDQNKLIVIPLGVDLDFYQPANKNEENAIMFSGHLDYPPNQEAIFYFFEKIWKNLKGLKWYIVGKKPGRNIKKLGEQDKNIIVTGFVDDIREYFSRAKVYVSPLLSGKGMKIKILEAMACGKAIVASPKSIENISNNHKEVLLVAKNDEEYSKLINQLLSDSSLREKLEKNARSFVEKNYSWQKISQEYESIFEKTIFQK